MLFLMIRRNFLTQRVDQCVARSSGSIFFTLAIFLSSSVAGSVTFLCQAVRTGRYYGHHVTAKKGQDPHDEPDGPDRPPVEQRAMADNHDLALAQAAQRTAEGGGIAV